ncbi:DUF3445 domain-containing protein [Kocuria palustris]|nr:DUF3445 domain-containing protein [Kocuria palustris]
MVLLLLVVAIAVTASIVFWSVRRLRRKLSFKSCDSLPEPTPIFITPQQLATYDGRPWRPFRWPYHQTMSIYKLDVNHWLDMDRYYPHLIELKQQVFAKWGRDYLDWLPESADGCQELMEVVVNHMLLRYPNLFLALNDDHTVIRNEITGDVIDMTPPLQHHPLEYVARIAQEDFYVVKQRPDGLHYLVAAAVAFPGGGFGVLDKLGQHLDVIHGEVPLYKEKLQKLMEKWFGRLEVGKPVERALWLLTWDHKLRTTGCYADGPHTGHQNTDLSTLPDEALNVRIERQALRRLPRSRVIVFLNHPLYYSIEEMKDEPMVPSLIKQVINHADERIVRYKNFPVSKNRANDLLDRLIARQLELGIIDKEEPIRTLPTYPFAHWVVQDVDENGWTNPGSSYTKEKYNWLPDKFDEGSYPTNGF